MPPEGVARRAPSGLFVGLSTLDVIQRVPHLPQRNAKVTALRQDIAAGGPALNAAVIFSVLGGRATLVTRLGTGPVSALIRADLEAHAVEIIDVADSSYRPAVSTITVDNANGDRQIVSTDAFGGAERLPDPPPAGKGVEPALAQVMPADIVHIDGHHPDIAAAAARTGAHHGVPRVLDAGRWKPIMADLIPIATDVVYSGDFRVPGHEKDLLDWTMDQGVDMAATTHGPEPTEWQTVDSTGFVASEPVEAVDTLGAGDFFHGAYSFARASRDPAGRPLTPQACLCFASHIAAVKCTKPGTRSWLVDIGNTSLFSRTME